MDITLFQDVTTEATLSQLESDGEKYTGLYVDMNDKEQRKYVKDSAVLINDLLKKLDRARIDKTKAYKTSVEAEAKDIRERLEAANLPFSMLIDAHKHERAQILAAEKKQAEAMALALQIEADHEHAILMDKVEMIEKAQREQARIDHDAQIAYDAAQQAIQQEQARIANEAKRAEMDRLQREADKEHVTSVLSAAKVSLMDIGLDEMVAVEVVKAIRAGKIANVSIQY